MPEDELRRKEAELDTRERDVARREDAVRGGSLRHNLYERITLSKRAVDAIIAICALLIAAFTIAGVLYGG